MTRQRTVVVTGAGSGLGRAIALAFAGAGDAVVVNDLKHESAECTAQEIVQAGGHARPRRRRVGRGLGAASVHRGQGVVRPGRRAREQRRSGRHSNADSRSADHGLAARRGRLLAGSLPMQP